MSNQIQNQEDLVSDSLQQEVETNSEAGTLIASDNPVIQRALDRLKASQSKENQYSGFKNHGSHNTHSKSAW